MCLKNLGHTTEYVYIYIFKKKKISLMQNLYLYQIKKIVSSGHKNNHSQ